MIAQTPAEVLGHYAALYNPQGDREKAIAEHERKIRTFIDRHSHDALKFTITSLRRKLRDLPDSSPIDPTILLEDIVERLSLHDIPIRQFGL